MNCNNISFLSVVDPRVPDARVKVHTSEKKNTQIEKKNDLQIIKKYDIIFIESSKRLKYGY